MFEQALVIGHETIVLPFTPLPQMPGGSLQNWASVKVKSPMAVMRMDVVNCMFAAWTGRCGSPMDVRKPIFSFWKSRLVWEDRRIRDQGLFVLEQRESPPP